MSKRISSELKRDSAEHRDAMKRIEDEALIAFRKILPGVVEVGFTVNGPSGGMFSVMGTRAMAGAAPTALPGCEVVDWSDDEDFVECGTPFEIYVNTSDLETILKGLRR